MRDYNENPIRVRSAFTWEGYKKMQRNMRGARRRVFVVIFVLYGLELMYFYIAFMTKRAPSALVVGAFAGGMAVFFLFFLFFLRMRGTIGFKRSYQKAKRRIGEGVDFTFFGDGWSTAHKSESYETQIKLGYSRIYKVAEADDAFYVFISRGKVLIVQKAGIENAEPQELGALLRKGVKPSRYKVLVRPRRQAGRALRKNCR